MSNTSESAISPTTSKLRRLNLRRRRKPVAEPAAPSFKASQTLTKDDCSAGTKPNSRPVSNANAKLKPSTRQSRLIVKKSKARAYDDQNCALSLGRNFVSNSTPQRATSTPNVPPDKA